MKLYLIFIALIVFQVSESSKPYANKRGYCIRKHPECKNENFNKFEMDLCTHKCISIACYYEVYGDVQEKIEKENLTNFNQAPYFVMSYRQERKQAFIKCLEKQNEILQKVDL